MGSVADHPIFPPLKLAWALNTIESYLYTLEKYSFPMNLPAYFTTDSLAPGEWALLSFQLFKHEAGSMGKEDLKVQIIQKKKKRRRGRQFYPCLLCYSFYSETSSHPNSLLNVLYPHPPSLALHSSKPRQLLHAISGSFLMNIEKCLLPPPPPMQPLNR